jgi:hypothetical protein
MSQRPPSRRGKPPPPRPPPPANSSLTPLRPVRSPPPPPPKDYRRLTPGPFELEGGYLGSLPLSGGGGGAAGLTGLSPGSPTYPGATPTTTKRYSLTKTPYSLKPFRASRFDFGLNGRPPAAELPLTPVSATATTPGTATIAGGVSPLVGKSPSTARRSWLGLGHSRMPAELESP